MKLLFTLLLSVFCSLGLMAQNTISKEDFLKNYMQAYANGNNNDAIITNLKQTISEYDMLSESDKEGGKNILAEAYYNLACSQSLAKDKKNAINSFSEALNNGYNNYRHADTDSDLDFIRNDKRFVKLMAWLDENGGNYVKTLKKATPYQKEDTTGYKQFVYEPIMNHRIQQVKIYLNLDSIAGNGDEISKIMNVLGWVHNTIEHNGSHWPHCELDAIDIYNYYQTTKKGVNCRALAIVLNECYLSLGLKSRFVTCLPKDETDTDCHVINSVYSETLNKWIWVDPTFNAYLKDERGNLLSINDVRSRIINDQPIVLNEDANWNNKNKQTKEGYIDSYMAKNLYWIQVPRRSIFNVETRYRNTNEDYISIVPPGFAPHKKSNNNFVTSDPDYFWQVP